VSGEADAAYQELHDTIEASGMKYTDEADAARNAESRIDHAFEAYPSGREALVDVCQVCGDYHDERRSLHVYPEAQSAPVFVDSGAAVKPSLHAPPVGAELEALADLRSTAKRLKAVQAEFQAAQQAYGEAIKRLSDEAVK
jgi:hypothetical protein